MGGKRVTKACSKLVQELHDSGYSIKDIIKETGISQNTIYKIIRGDWEESPTLLDECEVDLIRAFFSNKKSDPYYKVGDVTLKRRGSITELSEVFKISKGHLCRLLYNKE